MPEAHPNPAAERLRQLLTRGELILMPYCYDALSAKLIEQAGFELTFMSGFAASASGIGVPDTGLMSYGEVLDQARNILCGHCQVNASASKMACFSDPQAMISAA